MRVDWACPDSGRWPHLGARPLRHGLRFAVAVAAAPALTYWWLGNSPQTAQIGDLTGWGPVQYQSAGTGGRDHYGGWPEERDLCGQARDRRTQQSGDAVQTRTRRPFGEKVPVQFGAASVNLIEVKSGLQPGDRVIISDMSQHDRVAAIVLR
jgi:hypothetical protein